jgi:hypothetical protein
MSKPEQSVMCCPRCAVPMIAGHLKDPGNVIHVESLSSMECSSLSAWICPACGRVELQATHPEKLTRHDLSDEDLNAGRDEWEKDL